MDDANTAPPQTFRDMVERSGQRFRGWYAESAEGFRSRYREEEPVEALAKRLQALLGSRGGGRSANGR